MLEEQIEHLKTIIGMVARPVTESHSHTTTLGLDEHARSTKQLGLSCAFEVHHRKCVFIITMHCETGLVPRDYLVLRLFVLRSKLALIPVSGVWNYATMQ